MDDATAVRSWLPDFCRLPRIAAVLGIAELVVLIVAVAPRAGPLWGATELLAASAFALWISLCAAILLCRLRARIERLPMPAGIAMAVLLPMLVAVLGAWAVQQIDLGLGLGFTLPESAWLHFVGGIGLLTGLITLLALRYFYVREQWQAQVRAHSQAAMQALQARIRPHFLFNSMNTIASLVRRDPATAERAVEDLADLFRAALGADQGDATLAEEVALSRQFLAIEQLRLGDRLQVRWDLDEPLPAVPLPRLTLQPLLENAVVHGIARLPEGGEIHIEGRRESTLYRLRVGNPAPPPRERDVGNSHAQTSIAQRLAFRFGKSARMTTRFADGYYVSELELPLD